MAPFDTLRFSHHFFHFVADFVTLSYTNMAIFTTLLYTASLKKTPLSGGAPPYSPLSEVPPGGGKKLSNYKLSNVIKCKTEANDTKLKRPTKNEVVSVAYGAMFGEGKVSYSLARLSRLLVVFLKWSNFSVSCSRVASQDKTLFTTATNTGDPS